jgi:hypothetical protein
VRLPLPKRKRVTKLRKKNTRAPQPTIGRTIEI